jgi:hypothetical protein
LRRAAQLQGVGRQPIHLTWYGRQRILHVFECGA